MKELTLLDVAGLLERDIIPGFQNFPIKKISIDSRTIGQGDLFIAVKGKNFDGHDFIDEALSKGALGVIAERYHQGADAKASKNFILVKDSLEAMASLAGKIRRSSDIPCIGVTGTNGKTTVKDLTSSALSAKFNVLKSNASFNNIFGVCLTIFDMKTHHEAAVLELGTNSPGEISLLTNIVSPDVAVITNIGSGHLEALKDKGGVFKEKISILRGLSSRGAAILNGDDPMLAGFKKENLRALFYGYGDNCQIRISGTESTSSGTRFLVDGEEFLFSAPGRHNVYNAAAAIAVGRLMGVDTKDIKEKIRTANLPGMRLEKSDICGITFLNDAYNANPNSFNAALETLAAVSGTGEKWVIAGDMREMGNSSQETHKALGQRIADLKFDFLITIGDLGKAVLLGALDAGMRKDRMYDALSHTDAALMIKEKAPSGSTVLVKGSRSMKMEEVIKCFTTCCTR